MDTQKIFLRPVIQRIVSNFIVDKPILVTGSRRSGTTLVGKILSLPANVALFSEPFTRVGPIYFPYITNRNVRKYLNIFIRIIITHTPIFLRRLLYSRFFCGKKIIPLIKEPIAIFSAEWFAKEFGTNIIILIRHPAGFVSSIRKLNWRFGFQRFLQQKELMEDYLWVFEDEMRRPDKDIIYEGALLWKCFYYVVDKYRERHPDWIFLRHEDLCKNPVKEFENLYRKLGLPFSMEIRKKILEYSSSQNPVEPPNNEVIYLKRDSQSLIKQWKKRLTLKEIKRIRDIVGELSSKYYSEDEW